MHGDGLAESYAAFLEEKITAHAPERIAFTEPGNYCPHCRYDPKEASGEDACPFTTLYWDFLALHRERLSSNRRMNFQVKNLERKSEADRAAIADRAQYIRRKIREGNV